MKLTFNAPLNIGAATAASRPPAHNAGTKCIKRIRLPEMALKVNSSVKINGTASRMMSISLDVKEVILVWPIRCWMSLPDSVITAKPPHRAKKPSAALLFNKKLSTAGNKISVIKRASAISTIIKVLSFRF